MLRVRKMTDSCIGEHDDYTRHGQRRAGGQIESKMMRARQMEEIREARKKEAEVRQEKKRSKLVSTSSNWEAYCESIAAAIVSTHAE